MNAARVFARRISSSAAARGGGASYKPADWLAVEHAPLYNIQSIKNRKAFFGSWIAGIVGLGLALPVIAGEVIKYKMR